MLFFQSIDLTDLTSEVTKLVMCGYVTAYMVRSLAQSGLKSKTQNPKSKTQNPKTLNPKPQKEKKTC